MTVKELTYEDLNISSADVYEEMGYHGAEPDLTTKSETKAVMEEVRPWLRPQFCFMVVYGQLNLEESLLTLTSPHDKTQQATFNIHKIIAHQLKNSEAYACFVATAGVAYEDYQQQLMRKGDMVKTFIANALGSIIAERCADQMESAVQTTIEKLGWKHTNRFSPGYCSWHVSEQQKLFTLFGEEKPCGVLLTESSLMVPIKSVSGIIGVGKNVRKHDYTCGLCDFEQCYKKRRPTKKRP